MNVNMSKWLMLHQKLLTLPCSTVDGHDDAKVDELATKIVQYCTSHNIEDPIKMLRHFQKI